MMKNKFVPIGLVVGVILLAAIAYGVLNRQSQPQDSVLSPSTQSSNGSRTESGNIFSLIEAGNPRQCEFSYSGSNGSSSGKMKADGKGRGLMTMDIKTERGNTGTSNTLVLKDKVYSWTATGGQTIGLVFNTSTFTNNTIPVPAASGSQTVDPNQKFDLKCDDWKVDETTLSVPQNVNFMSLPNS